MLTWVFCVCWICKGRTCKVRDCKGKTCHGQEKQNRGWTLRRRTLLKLREWASWRWIAASLLPPKSCCIGFSRSLRFFLFATSKAALPLWSGSMLLKVQHEWRDVKLQVASVVYVECCRWKEQTEFDNKCSTSRTHLRQHALSGVPSANLERPCPPHPKPRPGRQAGTGEETRLSFCFRLCWRQKKAPSSLRCEL